MRLLITLTICFAILFSTNPVQGKVIQVFFTHRHGARGPITNITDISMWTLPEQLTPVGMRQLYLLGDELRKRYILDGHLISENYDPRSVYVRSTKVNRTLQSAYSFLAGFFPNGTGPTFNESYPLKRAVPPINYTFDVESLERFALPKNFQVVPVHSTEKNKDYLLRGYSFKDSCPNMRQYNTKALAEPVYQEIMDKFKPIFEQVIDTLHIKAPNRNMESMQYLADTMQMSYLDNRKMGDLVVGSDLYNQMEIFHNISALYLLYTYPIQSKVGSTVYFNEIIKQMDAAVAGVSPLKFVEYSAHDDTVNCILTALGITSWQCLWENYLAGNYTQFNTSCPFTAQPAASIIFELSEEDDKKKYVTFLYNGLQYKLNGKDKLEYSEFKSYVKTITVENYEEYCLGPKTQPNSLLSWWQVVVLVVQAILIIGLAALLFSNCLKLHRQPSTLRRSLLEDKA